jgi:negative regulator of flagellin synthesis FlgM
MAIDLSRITAKILQASDNLPASSTQKAESDIQVRAVRVNTNATTASNVHITSRAHNLQQAAKLMTEIPEVNQERVQSLRAAIDSGRYHIDSETLAKKMVTFESGLGSFFENTIDSELGV